MSPEAILALPFYELENLKIMYDILVRGKISSQLDNQPKE